MDCTEARDLMAEYIGQDLDDKKREEAACHLDECDSCFNEIKRIDRAIWALECDCRAAGTPQHFLSGMEEGVLAGIKPRINVSKIRKHKKIIWAVSLSAVVILIVFSFLRFVPVNVKYRVYAAATFGKIYSSDEGTFGRKLNISSTSKDIKVTAVKIAADDMGTVIYFKVNGPDDGYFADYGSLVTKEKLKDTALIGNQLLTGSSIDSGGFILYLKPVDNGTKVLHLSFSRLNRVVGESDAGSVDGIWSFALPIEKFSSALYDLNRSCDIDGHNITFNKLVTGPTGTYLQYGCDTDSTEKYITGLNDCELVNGKQVCKQAIDIGFSENSHICQFASIYPASPGKIVLNIKSYNEVTRYNEGIKIPVNMQGKFPVSFNYDGNTITIDSFKNNDGNIQFDMIEPSKKRNYSYIYMYFEDSDGVNLNASTIPQKYYIIDENNVEYSYDDLIKNYAKYKDKHFEAYTTDTAVSFTMKDKGSKYFNIDIVGSQGINHVNDSIILK